MNIELIKRDFAAFADPATPVVVLGREISWTQSRETRSASFADTAPDFPDISFGGKTFQYREFFASSAMADLHGLAEKISSSLPDLPGFVGEVFLEPPLTEED